MSDGNVFVGPFFAQSATVTGNTSINGNLGIGCTNPPLTKMQIGATWTFYDGSTNKNIGRNTWNNGSSDVKIEQGVASRINFSSGGDINLQTAPTGSAGSPISAWNTVTINNSSNVGIGTTSPQSKPHVAGGNLSIREGSTFSISLGNASGANLGYGTAYIGFNATRNNSNGNWTLVGDGAHNGGSVIWSNVQGDIFFAAIPSTGSSSKTVSDADVRENIKLHVTNAGKLRTKEVEVSLTGWPDFVFEKDYVLLPLKEVEQFITENQHLPNVPSAAEVEANGVNLGVRRQQGRTARWKTMNRKIKR